MSESLKNGIFFVCATMAIVIFGTYSLLIPNLIRYYVNQSQNEQAKLSKAMSQIEYHQKILSDQYLESKKIHEISLINSEMLKELKEIGDTNKKMLEKAKITRTTILESLNAPKNAPDPKPVSEKDQ